MVPWMSPEQQLGLQPSGAFRPSRADDNDCEDGFCNRQQGRTGSPISSLSVSTGNVK